MIGGIVGDIIGSVYEAHQWSTKEQALIQELPFNKYLIKPMFENSKWIRKDYSWTDDTLCTLALYNAYITNASPVESLLYFCNKYKEESIGFGKSFEDWLNNPIPYNSYGNGSIMRIGFIPYLKITLEEKLKLGYEYTALSHNHPDSFEAVEEFILLSENIKEAGPNNFKLCLKEILQKYNYNENIESLHNLFKFEMNAIQTFLQACVIVLESNSFEDVLVNSFYVGGDSDTLACISANLASLVYEIPIELINLCHNKLEKFNDLHNLLNIFLSENRKILKFP